MNNWFITGKLINDPNYREVGGVPVADFTMSVRTRGRDDNGYPKTVLVRCTCWRKLAELCQTFDVRKGRVLALSGMADLREYTNKDGVLCKSLELDVGDIDFLPLNNAPAQDAGNAAHMPQQLPADRESGMMVVQESLPF